MNNNRDPERGEPALDDLLRALADDDARVKAPERLQSSVMALWDSERAAADPAGSADAVPFAPAATMWRRQWVGRVAALAAAVLLAVAWLMARAVPGGAPVERTSVPLSAATNLVTGPPLETESLQLVRVRMTRGTLRAFGIALVDPDAAAEVEVDMIVGEDGFPRSIRRVQAAGAVKQ